MYEVPRLSPNQERDERRQRLIELVSADFSRGDKAGVEHPTNPLVGRADLEVQERYDSPEAASLRDELADLLISATGTTDSFKYYVGQAVAWAHAKLEPVSARVAPDVLAIDDPASDGIYDPNASPRIEGVMLRTHLDDVAALTVSDAAASADPDVQPARGYVTDPTGFAAGLVLLADWDYELQDMRGQCALTGPLAYQQLSRVVGAQLRPRLVATDERMGGDLALRRWQPVREAQTELAARDPLAAT